VCTGPQIILRLTLSLRVIPLLQSIYWLRVLTAYCSKCFPHNPPPCSVLVSHPIYRVLTTLATLKHASSRIFNTLSKNLLLCPTFTAFGFGGWLWGWRASM